MLDGSPTLLGDVELRERLAVNLGLGCENSHLLAVTAIGVAIGNLALKDTALLRDLLLETCRVQSCERGELVRLEA